MKLQGKVALVTGASRGIGNATALALASEGATVIGTATTQAGVDAIKEHLAQYNGLACIYDAGQADSLNALQKFIQDNTSGVDILVANAGITDDGLSIRLKPEQWQRIIDINLSAVFQLIQANIGGMVKKRYGKIIAVSSVVASLGNAGQANYCASKAGLESCCRSLAREFASRGITVNSVAPGYIETDMANKLSDAVKQHFLSNIPLRRAGKPEEIAHIIKFLASEEANYITGQTLHVNGGMLMN